MKTIEVTLEEIRMTTRPNVYRNKKIAGLSRNNTSNSSALRWLVTNGINTYLLSLFTHQTLNSPNTNYVITTHRRTGNNIDVYLNNTMTTNSS
jgi:hypothetical protein